jgi:hypothetical protein
MHLVDAEITGYTPRRPLIVACDQDRLETGIAQRGDGRNGVRSERVAQRDATQRATLTRDGDHGPPRRLESVDAHVKLREVDITVGEEPRAADENLAGADARDDTLSGERLE